MIVQGGHENSTDFCHPQGMRVTRRSNAEVVQDTKAIIGLASFPMLAKPTLQE